MTPGVTEAIFAGVMVSMRECGMFTRYSWQTIHKIVENDKRHTRQHNTLKVLTVLTGDYLRRNATNSGYESYEKSGSEYSLW